MNDIDILKAQLRSINNTFSVICNDLNDRINVLENIIQEKSQEIETYEFDSDDTVFLNNILGKDYHGSI